MPRWILSDCAQETIDQEKINHALAEAFLRGILSTEEKNDFYMKVREEGAVSWLLRIGNALAGSNKTPREIKDLVADLKKNIF